MIQLDTWNSKNSKLRDTLGSIEIPFSCYEKLTRNRSTTDISQARIYKLLENQQYSAGIEEGEVREENVRDEFGPATMPPPNNADSILCQDTIERGSS